MTFLHFVANVKEKCVREMVPLVALSEVRCDFKMDKEEFVYSRYGRIHSTD